MDGWGSTDVSLRTMLFGTDYPSPRRVAAMAGMALVIVSGIAARFVAFMPHPMWHAWTGIAIATALAILAVVVMGRSLLHSPTPGSRTFLVVLAVIGTPVLAWALAGTLSTTLPSLWTRVLGDAWRLDTVTQVYERRYRRRGCTYRMTGGALERTQSGGLCLSRADYERHRGDAVAVTLVGRRTTLGALVQSVEYRDGRQ